MRQADEWFEEPDDLDRVSKALASVEHETDPVTAAGLLAFRVTRAQGFAEGNKRTALLLARWVLDRNGIDGSQILRNDDLVLADLLVQAAAGIDVEDDIVSRVRQGL